MRKYSDIKSILKENEYPKNRLFENFNYHFFNVLENAVYDGTTADQFRQAYKLPQIKYMKKTRYVNSQGFDSFINEDAIIPYWEIHHYKDGFTKEDDSGILDYFDKDGQELHFYFTFKRLIPDYFYNTLQDWVEAKKIRGLKENIYRDENGGLVIGLTDNKIDKNYGSSSQQGKGIQVHVLDDDEDNFNVLSDIMPGGMLSFLKDHNVSDFKPSDLPQMLFISGENHYLGNTENVNSIVCLESNVSRTRESEEDTGLVKLKGNLFVKHDCPLMVREIGKNTILGEGTRVHHSCVIGNNVVTGYRSLLYDCEIGDYSVICDNVHIYKSQKIPAFQTIKTRPTFFSQKAGGVLYLTIFFDLAKVS